MGHAANAPVLDRALLDSYTMSNAELQRELFWMFFEQTIQSTAAMEAAVANGDIAAWRAGAHTMKGIASALGLSQIATITARAQRGNPSAETLATLRKAIDAAREAAAPLMAA